MSKRRGRRKSKFVQPDFDYEPLSEPDLPPPLPPRRKTKLTLLVDPAKIAQLMRASFIPIKEKPKEAPNLDYPTYTEEQVRWLLRDHLTDKKS